jgi:RNA polymerase sigma-70 factor, ECF subfamily
MVRMLGSGVRSIPSEAETESASFEAFFGRHYRRLFQALYLLTSNHAEAEDVAQEAMLRVWQRWKRVGRMENPDGYLYRTALNLHRSGLRKLARWARRTPAEHQPDDPIGAADARLEVHRALGALPRGQREALVLVEWVGLSAREATRVLGIKSASIRSRVHRAREKLKSELGGGDV